MLASLAIFSQAGAQVRVYHSPGNDGLDPGGTAPVDPSSSVTLHLYIDNPGDETLTGSVCEDGDGSELCGYDLTLEALGGIQLTSFSEVADTTFSLTQARLRLNAVEAIDGVVGPIHVGDLLINASTGTTVNLTAGSALDASLTLVPIAPRSLISVPEPGFLTLLGGGLLALTVLGRRRRR